MKDTIKYAKNQINAYKTEYPKDRGMNTKITVLRFHETGATLIWMGTPKFIRSEKEIKRGIILDIKHVITR